jgi:hypothetical protein
MRYSGFACRSLLVSAFVAATLSTLPAQAQAPRPGQLAPGPGQVQPPGPRAEPTQAQPPGQPGQAPQEQAQQPAPPKPYKSVPVTLPQPYGDPSFAAFRKQLADIASRKDRAALARLVVRNFFWMGEKGDKADKKKSGIDNLAAAIDLDAKDGFGWEALTAAADEATLEPVPERKGVMCSPANPKFDEKAADQVAKDTGTDPSEWGYPSKPDVEVHAAAQADASVIEKLGLNLVRVMPEQPAAGASEQEQSFLRVVTPSGKVGFVLAELMSSLDTDQLCYIKDATGWKIAGYAGND